MLHFHAVLLAIHGSYKQPLSALDEIYNTAAHRTPQALPTHILICQSQRCHILHLHLPCYLIPSIPSTLEPSPSHLLQTMLVNHLHLLTILPSHYDYLYSSCQATPQDFNQVSLTLQAMLACAIMRDHTFIFVVARCRQPKPSG